METRNEIHRGKPIAVTIALIVLIISVSYGGIRWINHMEEAESFKRLHEETEKIENYIEAHIASDREELEMITVVISQYDELDSGELWTFLDSYDSVGMMSRIELLLPGDMVLTEGGKYVDAKGLLSFEKEEALGAHITDRETDLTSDNYVVRHYVPVRRDGETVAMLYGVISLEELPEVLAGFDGNASIYIIDGATGDFLLDTWHPGEAGNIWALGERKMAPGYDHEQLKQGLIDGKKGYVVFVSETVGEYLYFYYEPLAVNEWRLALSVPESIVFETANEIREALNIILILEIICFILYFLWMLRYTRHVTSEKQHKLETINYMYDVEKLLFNAHEKQENVTIALGKIAHILSAERVGFWMIGKSRDDTPFLWKKDALAKDQEETVQKKNIYTLLKYFDQGNSIFEADNIEILREKLPDNEHDMIQNIAAVPVEDLDGNICGILVSCNMKTKKADASLLQSVKYSFSMFCQNLSTFNAVKEQGENDTLTGMHNRNKYEADLLTIRTKYEKSLACIYIDVNGLHELNNTQGHSRGDAMLKTVAQQICRRFDTEFTYRIGGDEFLVFVPDMPEEKVEDLCRQLAETLEKDDYHISAGVEWEADIDSITGLVKAAEKKMYAAKRAYYEREENDRRKTVRI